MSHAKIRQGISDGQIRKMMTDDSFTDTVTEIQEDVWNAFKEVVKKFFWQHQGLSIQRNCKKHVGQA
jgi:hypothetical protein